MRSTDQAAPERRGQMKLRGQAFKGNRSILHVAALNLFLGSTYLVACKFRCLQSKMLKFPHDGRGAKKVSDQAAFFAGAK